MSINVDGNKKTNSNKKLFFADLFAGIGGFHLAFKKSIQNSKILSENNIKLIAVSEIDKYAKEVYYSQYNNEIKLDDFFDIKNFKDKIQKGTEIDILFSGFPCQPFSNAGKKMGFEDYRGTLIFRVVELIESYKPKIILLENVKHLVTHNNGETFKNIVEKISLLNYATTEEPIILCPTHFGIPQKRERVFIPFVNKDFFNVQNIDYHDFNKSKKEMKLRLIDEYLLSEEEVLKEEKKRKTKFFINDKDFLKIMNAWKEFVNHFIHKKKIRIPVIWLDEMIFGEKVSKSRKKNSEWFKKYMSSMKSFYFENKNFIDDWIKKHKPFNWKNKRNRKLEWQAGFDCNFEDAFLQERQSGLRFKSPKIFPTLVATVQVPIICRNKKWRRLTPLETSRLQSFDDNYQICNNVYQAYKQHGNSINVEVVKNVINAYLLKYIEELYERK